MVAFAQETAAWFAEKFGEPTAPQREGWPKIKAGLDVLIAAPTGSGKTLAAFLSAIDDLLVRAKERRLEDKTYVVYVSPLRALSNDISKNLAGPLADLRALAQSTDPDLPDIRIGVRTGDTPQGDRAKMAKKVPHILVTTPESLYIMLTSEKARFRLNTVQAVIVDEIHAIADDKRGAHLALSLERLDDLVERTGAARPQRIGLSATQKPIEEIARFLGGSGRPSPHIADTGFARHLDLAIEIPSEELGAVASHEMMSEVCDRIAALVLEHKTTLVFANTRRLVERLSHALGERLGEEKVAAHHGSLSRQTRLLAEERLKHGEAKVVIATASLELGIDVGTVDLVVQIGSPRSIAIFLQRVGRSGHSLGATPKGRLFALTRDQLIECAALIRSVKKRELDRIETPDAPLDVLAQQIVAAAANEELDEDALYTLCCRAWPYRALLRSDFDGVLEMLGEGITVGKGRTEALLHRDRINKKLRGRRRARIIAITSGGAIPDTADYAVIAEPEETFVGTLHEDFAIESSAGDIFLLGNTSWRIRRVEAGKVRVENAHGAPPTVPFWIGEAPARTRELSAEISLFREEVEHRLSLGLSAEELAVAISADCSMPAAGAEQIVEYLAAARCVLGALPTVNTIIAERFFDEAGGMQLILHAPLGGRINRAYGLALRKRFCRSFNFELQAAATDDGIVISLGPMHSFPLETIFDFLTPETVQEVLEQAVLAAPVWQVRWRWNVQRSLAVPRRRGGKKVPPQILRMRADDLMAAVFPMASACLENVEGDIELPDHPLVAETMHDCLHEAMDLEGLRDVLTRIKSGAIKTLARDTAEPSMLAHELLNANPYAYLDDAPLEERRARAVSLRRRGLPAAMETGIGALDLEAIRTADSEAKAEIRDADELHDVLLSRGLYFGSKEQEPWMTALIAAKRATVATWPLGQAWVAAEKTPLVSAAIPEVSYTPALPPLPFDPGPADSTAAHLLIVRGYLAESGPVLSASLAAELGLDPSNVEFALLGLESEGAILRGSFTPGVSGVEWCDRRILARIHRLTIGRLRKEIEPVSAADLMRFLFRWQHVAKQTQLATMRGTLEVIAQLEGLELSATAWERDVFRARVSDFDEKHLDQLTASGEIAWGRLAPRDAGELSRAMPIAILLRDDLAWLLGAGASAETPQLSEPARDVLLALEQRGASFVREIAASSKRLLAEVEDALRELVFAGLATADSYAGMRSLLDRTLGENAKPMHMDRFDPFQGAKIARYRINTTREETRAGGRWSLLRGGVELVFDVEAEARLLLARYGVVFRDLLGRESRPIPWRELLQALRRMEARGEVRGGRFVGGFVGEQYALPEAVEGLRAVRKKRDEPEMVRISGSDPLNLVGVVTPGPRVPAVGDNMVLFIDGVPVASREAGKLVLRGALPDGAQIDHALRISYGIVTPREQERGRAALR
jgi:ATP-dependent Lhr-like helicase